MARGATHVLGLDIGSQTIKAVELRRMGREIHMIGRPVVIPTPEHSVSGGRIVETAAVSEALQELLSQNGFKTHNVVASVGGESDVVVRITQVPKMSGKELEEAMQWELERQAPFPVDQAVYDYQPIIRPDTPPEAENMDVLLAVALEDMVDAHVQTLLAAKLTPLAIDVEPLAIARALVDAAGDELADQTVAIVHIGASHTVIMIVRKKLLAFVRTIPTAGLSLTAAIRQNVAEDEATAEKVKRLFADLTAAYAYEPAAPAPEATAAFEALGGEEEELEGAESVFELSDTDRSLSELEAGAELATQLDVDAGGAYVVPPEQQPMSEKAQPEEAAALPPEIEAVRTQVYEAIAQPLLDLATEVRRSLDFYRRGHRDEEITHVYLSGGTAVIPGLAQFLSVEIGTNVEIADPFANVVVTEEVSEEYLRDVGPLCVVAVGLAMRDMFG